MATQNVDHSYGILANQVPSTRSPEQERRYLVPTATLTQFKTDLAKRAQDKRRKCGDIKATSHWLGCSAMKVNTGCTKTVEISIFRRKYLSKAYHIIVICTLDRINILTNFQIQNTLKGSFGNTCLVKSSKPLWNRDKHQTKMTTWNEPIIKL